MSREPYKRSEHSETYGMSLPVGKTCGDCIHIGRCEAMFGHIPADETCDWSPSRFRDRVEYWTQFVAKMYPADRAVLSAALIDRKTEK